MKIESVNVPAEGNKTDSRTKVVMVRITGPADRNNPIIQRAREMVTATGSKEAIASFEAGLADELFRSDR